LSNQQKIVVDGYNVIYADDRLRRIALKDMERARRDLLSRIEAYIADKELRVTVVFDGSGGTTDTRAIVPGKLQVVFSARRQTADELIVSIITASEKPSSYIVVTSDRAHIRPAVASSGCHSIGAKSFLDRLSGKKPARSRPAKEEKPRPGSEDMNFWLDRFGADTDGDP